jgi:hypothetical protein
MLLSFEETIAELSISRKCCILCFKFIFKCLNYFPIFHSLAVPSSLPVNIYFPSDENSAWFISECP